MLRAFSLGAALCCLSFAAQAQERIALTQYCVFDGSTLSEEVYGFDSDEEAQAALNRVMRHAGLEPNFIIQAANVPNAVAAIDGSQRLILYNQEFMINVRDLTNTDWSTVSILAHEVGHHLQGHTLMFGGSRPPTELEADKYSGFILQRMGATLEEAQAAMQLVADEMGSATHPGREARLAAITNGWVQGRDLNEQTPDTGPPPSEPVAQETTVKPRPTPSETPENYPIPPSTEPTYVARAVFPSDPNAYFITAGDEIIGVVPETGQAVLVGARVPPTYPGFAWMYQTPHVTYGVTSDGRILSRDAMGNTFQVGYITTQ